MLIMLKSTLIGQKVLPTSVVIARARIVTSANNTPHEIACPDTSLPSKVTNVTPPVLSGFRAELTSK